MRNRGDYLDQLVESAVELLCHEEYTEEYDRGVNFLKYLSGFEKVSDTQSFGDYIVDSPPEDKEILRAIIHYLSPVCLDKVEEMEFTWCMIIDSELYIQLHRSHGLEINWHQ